MATVSQVCKNDVYKDVGASNRFQFVFSSFVKTRLNCSIQSNPPLYLDRVLSVSDVINMKTSSGGNHDVVFATMKSSRYVLKVQQITIVVLKQQNFR